MRGLAERRCLDIDFDNFGSSASRDPWKPGHGIHHAGGADQEQKVAGFNGRKRTINHCGIQRLPKPHDVGSQQCATGGTSCSGARRRFYLPTAHCALPTVLEDRAFSCAPHPPDVAMELDEPPASCTRVQAIDVLGEEQKLRDPRLETCQYVMASIRLRIGNSFATPAVPFPDQLGVTLERLRRCEILGAKRSPQAIGSTECRDAALGRNSSPGNHRDRSCGTQPRRHRYNF